MNLSEILLSIEGAEQEFVHKAKERTAQLVMPQRALGELHVIGERLCGILRTSRPSVNKKAFLIAAGDHGIAASGVSAYPQIVTGEMVKTFMNGGAGISVLARHVGAEVTVLDAGIIPDISPETNNNGRLIVNKVARGTRDFSKGPAMDRREAENSILAGFGAAGVLFEKGVELLGTGDMGIGNTSPSSAIGSVITKNTVEVMTGRGTGLDDEGLKKKCEKIEMGIKRNNPDPDDGLDVLSKVGGFEIGAIAGAILAAAFNKKPIIIDGFISGAGALIAYSLNSVVKDYIFAGHESVEQGHKKILDFMGLKPILNLGMRLGEGTGAALAMFIVEAGARVINEVFTFKEAEVSKGE